MQEILSLNDAKRQFTNDEVERICSTFNGSLRYEAGMYYKLLCIKKYRSKCNLFADDPKLCYSIRDLIVTDAMSVPKGMHPRGFCRKITVRSQCHDAGLVLDGGIAVPFNFGTIAEIETFPEDSLRTITFPD